MSNLNQFVQQPDHKPQQTANIRGPKRQGTTDDDEGRRGLHRHQEEDEDGRMDNFEEDNLRDAG
jgi:hypothetical protein